MKIGVIGYTGTVGTELIKRGYDPMYCDVRSLDGVRNSIVGKGYDVIIYAAGITDVDACEKNPDEAKMVNVFGVSNVVDVYGGRLIYIQFAIDGKLVKRSGDYPQTGQSKFKLTPCGRRVAKYLLEREKQANSKRDSCHMPGIRANNLLLVVRRNTNT